MSSRRTSHSQLGITIVEVIIIILVVFVSLIAWGVYYNSRPSHPGGHQLRCKIRVYQIHKGMVLFAQDFGGRYPEPMLLSPETAAIGAQTGNSNANYFSYMIFNTYYSPETVVCPEESNENIIPDQDYRYGTVDDDPWDDWWQWDPTFSSDFRAGEANSSYALLAPIGARHKTEWLDTRNASFAVASDRGPKDGVFDSESLTMRSHGKRNEWVGNVAFNDGHAERLVFDASDAQPFTFNGDNLFFADEGIDGADIWLGVWGDSDNEKVTPIWD